MKVNIDISSPSGVVAAPPSKSDSHRLLICAGLAQGRSVIENIALSEDIKATIRCLEALGCRVKAENGTVAVDGIQNIKSDKPRKLDCGESGSTLRFFIPICLLGGGRTELTGSVKLLSRPMSVYSEICKNQGISMDISPSGITLDGRLSADTFSVKGNISSQFISGLLFALPLLDSQSIINIMPPFESRPYVDMTADALKKFGVSVEFTDSETVKISGGQRYFPCTAGAEGDWSNAAFFYAFKESGADVEITGTDTDSAQGDKICVDYFRRLKDGFCTLDIADCPDLAPILFAFAAKHNGARFVNTDRLRMKESDRIAAMKQELDKVGAVLSDGENEVTVSGGGIHKPDSIICGHNDHRIVMAMAYLLTFTGGAIDGYEAVRKSYPDYFEVLKNAGVKINYEA